MDTLTSKSGTFPISPQLQVSLYQAAASVVQALQECDPKLREHAVELLSQLNSGELDEGESFSTITLISEILFPNADDKGMIGMDLAEAEKIAAQIKPAAGAILAEMDAQEKTFADRLRRILDDKGMTQGELAKKVGLGQSAISMMLNRTCRPQRATIRRIAAALEISPDDLWNMNEPQG